MEGKKKGNPVTTKKDDMYLALVEEKPEREVELIAEEKVKTLAEKEDELPSLTDMQAVLKRLFPDFLGDQTSNAAMVGRIAPDVFLSLLHLMTVEDILKTDPREKISVVTTLLKNYVLLSIGLDGKGRIDQIELAGASKESEELEKLGKELF